MRKQRSHVSMEKKDWPCPSVCSFIILWGLCTCPSIPLIGLTTYLIDSFIFEFSRPVTFPAESQFWLHSHFDWNCIGGYASNNAFFIFPEEKNHCSICSIFSWLDVMMSSSKGNLIKKIIYSHSYLMFITRISIHWHTAFILKWFPGLYFSWTRHTVGLCQFAVFPCIVCV